MAAWLRGGPFKTCWVAALAQQGIGPDSPEALGTGETQAAGRASERGQGKGLGQGSQGDSERTGRHGARGCD